MNRSPSGPSGTQPRWSAAAGFSRVRRTRIAAVLALAFAPILSTGGGVSAQEVLPGPWAGIAVGSGLRLDEPAGILSDRFGAAGHLRVGYGLESGLSFGVEWSRIQLVSSVADLDRQTVSAVAFLPRGPEGTTHLKLGLGMGISTRVEIEGPPEEGAGDRLVTIGDESGLGATAGVSFRVPVRSWVAINPGLDVYLQRLDGLTTTTVVASVGLVLGRHRDVR